MLGKKKKPKEDKDAEVAVDSAPAAEGAEGAEGEGAPEGKKKPPMMLIIAAAAAVVIVGGGGTAAFLVFGHHAPAAGKPAKDDKGKKAEKKDAKKDGKSDSGVVIADGPDGVVFYTLPSMVVNMQTDDGRPTFLKLKLTLELPDSATADALDPNLPRLTDMFQLFLRELRPEDLTGSQGGYQLRMEILRRVNLVIAPAKVNSVLIEEMLVN